MRTPRCSAPPIRVVFWRPSAPRLPLPVRLHRGAPDHGKNVAGVASASIGVAVFTFAAFAFLLYSPGPPSYTLTPDALTFHDKFYPVTL